MKIFLLDDPARPGRFAQFAHVGTWESAEICSGCGGTPERLVEPLKIEWDKGTDRIGSFSWCGYHCVVTNEVREFFERSGAECVFGRVEVVPPTEKTRKPRVPFPYVGPQLHWLIPTRRVKLNEVRSGVRMVSDCPLCGRRRFSFKKDGLFIDAVEAKDASMFLVDQFGQSRATFITERLLAGLETAGFTNLSPRLAGSIA